MDWRWALAIGLVALAVSLPGLFNELVQDDYSLLLESTRLHDPGSWRVILGSSYWPPPHAAELYRPLTSLFLALQFGFGGGHAVVFRIASYLLYAGSAIAVFLLAGRLLPAWVARVAGLGFALHPVHVEAVALAVGQAELLVGLFGTLMVIRYLEGRRARGTDLRVSDWAFVIGCYVAACFSKEHGLVLPGLLLAAEVTLLSGREAGRWRRLAPGYALLGAAGILTLLVRRLVLGELAGSFVAPGLQGLDFGQRFLTMLAVVPEWARLMVWPIHLQADYSPREIVAATGFGGSQLLGLAVVAGGVALAGWARHRAPVLAFGLFWIGIALFPVSNLLVPTGVVLAERTLFLASAGLVLALGGGLGWAADRIRLPGLPRYALPLVLAAAGVALGVRTAVRHRAWRDDATVRIQGVKDAPQSWRTQLSYGSWLFEAGRRDSALDRYQRALALAPLRERWRVRDDLAVRYLAEGENDRAAEQLRQSVREGPGSDNTRYNLVLALLALGAYEEATAEADSALAHGGSPAMFDELRALADTAKRAGVPPGGIRIRVRPMGRPSP